VRIAKADLKAFLARHREGFAQAGPLNFGNRSRLMTVARFSTVKHRGPLVEGAH
jgi:hypothetical protein